MVFNTSEKFPIINSEDLNKELVITNSKKSFKNHLIVDFTLVNKMRTTYYVNHLKSIICEFFKN